MATYLFSVAFLVTLFWMVEHLFGNKQERHRKQVSRHVLQGSPCGTAALT